MRVPWVPRVCVLAPPCVQTSALCCRRRDVLLLVMSSKGCADCMAMTPYYRRVAQRFRDLGISTVTVARMDVAFELPPPEVCHWFSTTGIGPPGPLFVSFILCLFLQQQLTVLIDVDLLSCSRSLSLSSHPHNNNNGNNDNNPALAATAGGAPSAHDRPVPSLR